MTDGQPFAPPRHVSNISDCDFYHVMELPGHGTVGEGWDLRGGERAYLGGVSFEGKRVLELGTASGFLCRYMEHNGADVIGFDLPSDRFWDLVPFAKFDMTTYAGLMRHHVERIKNGWWFAHHLLGSKAKAVYGNIYAIPREIGPVDIATFGAILLHLRDPFHALYNATRLTRETVIVTEVHPEQPVDSPLRGVAPPTFLSRGIRRLLGKDINRKAPHHPGIMYFRPDYRETDQSMAVTWWCLSPALVCEFLGVLGFETTVVTEHLQLSQGKKAKLYTVVGSRTRPISESA